MTTSSGQSTNNSNQNTQTQPWQPAIPLLQQQLTSIGGINTSPTGLQQNAVGGLIGAAGSIPNLAPLAATGASNLASGAPNVNQFLGSNYDTLAKNLNPFFQPGFADPTKNPQLAQVIDTIKNDVTNQVNGQFSAAGRDLSPANSQALGRGLAQGEAVPLLDEYNTLLGLQQNAAGTLANAGLNTGTGFQRGVIGGTGIANDVAPLTLAGPSASLAAANTQYGLPLANIAGTEGLTIPIAGLGGQSSSQGTSTTSSSYTPSLESSILAPMSLFSGGSNSAFNGLYAAGQTGFNLLGSLFSPFSMFG